MAHRATLVTAAGDERRVAAGVYCVAAALVSLVVLLVQWLLWFSIIGHDTWLPLVLRWGAAFGLGFALTRRTAWWPGFVSFELPQFLSINSLALMSFIDVPRDPAGPPFALAVFGISLGDLVLWLLGRVARRFLGKRSG